MNPADYARDLDAWFSSNGHPHRCATLQPSIWQDLMNQGMAPAVAGSRIVAAYPPPAPPPSVPVNFTPPTLQTQRANTPVLRKCAKWVRAMAICFIGLGSLGLFSCVALFLMAVIRGRETATVVFMMFIGPAATAFSTLVVGCLIMGVAEIFVAVADFHDKYI